jgi:Polyketide cyclase / dehydrase and lipid transport
MRTVEMFVTSAPVETVWGILADVKNWNAWTPTILEITLLSGGGLRVGARYLVNQPGLKPAIYEVIRCVQNEAFAWVQKLPGGQLIADHRIASRDGATEVELSFASEGLSAHLACALFSKKLRQFVAMEARCLRQKCEAVTKA